jgi:hypothetical protein
MKAGDARPPSLPHPSWLWSPAGVWQGMARPSVCSPCLSGTAASTSTVCCLALAAAKRTSRGRTRADAPPRATAWRQRCEQLGGWCVGSVARASSKCDNGRRQFGCVRCVHAARGAPHTYRPSRASTPRPAQVHSVGAAECSCPRWPRHLRNARPAMLVIFCGMGCKRCGGRIPVLASFGSWCCRCC